MRLVTPRRVPLWTAVLSVVSLAVVFGTVGGFVPESQVPSAPAVVLDAVPTVNVGISLLAIATIGRGWRRIRRGDVDGHRRAMVGAMALFVTFLALYLYRLAAVGGATPFEGPEVVYLYVYLPVLIVHVGLAVLCLPLLFYALLLATVHSPAALRRTRHASAGRIVAPLWIASFALGIVVYLLTHVAY